MAGEVAISEKIGILNALVSRLETTLEKTATLCANLNILLENHSTRLQTQEKAVEDIFILMGEHDEKDDKNFKEIFKVLGTEEDNEKYEKRLSDLEKFKWKAMGIVTATVGIFTLIANAIGFYVFQLK